MAEVYFRSNFAITTAVRFVYGLLQSSKQFLNQNSDAYVYLAFWWRRYLLAHYVCALRFL